MFLGLLCAFSAGVDFMIRDNLRYGNLWFVGAGGAFIFWVILFVGVEPPSNNQTKREA